MAPRRKSSPALEQLKAGQVPTDDEILREISVARNSWMDFVLESYFKGFILLGGSKVKFLVGKEGVGKTHTLRLVGSLSSDIGYLPVYLDAREIRLQRIDFLYKEIVNRLDIPSIVFAYCKQLGQKITGKKALECQNSELLRKFLISELGSPDALTGRIKKELAELLSNRKIHRYFGVAMMHLAQDALGLKGLAVDKREIFYSWLKGDPVPAPALRQFQVFTKLDRYNGRNMLRSLFAFIRMAGYAGTLVCIDCLENLVNEDPDIQRAIYSRIARDDAYEMIRQLIDEIEEFESVIFLFAARPELFTHSTRGVKTYYALWMRIQEEVVLRRFNKFADTVKLDNIFDPPSPDSPEEILIRAIFGDQSVGGNNSLTSEEEYAVTQLGELSSRVASIGELKPLSEREVTELLRTKGRISPVKRVILETIGDR
jgi:hypothetical protein